jgi:tetratricopeptide (TPR) repeat protein
MNSTLRKILAGLVALVLLAGLAMSLPPVRERITWRIDSALIWLRTMIDPPEKVDFSLSSTSAPVALISPTVVVTATQPATPTPQAATPIPATPTSTATPLPASVRLQGVIYQTQHGFFNYCAPANLFMTLSYWGWQGSVEDLGPALKPFAKDKNVMPYEMVDYVNTYTNLKAIERVGGDLDLLKRMLAAGYPVLIEKGFRTRDLNGRISWMGHYNVITGYDDSKGIFIVQDSYINEDNEVAYDLLDEEWLSFNYVYVMVYPPENENEVLALLGTDADEMANVRAALEKSSTQIYQTEGVDQFFAWYNYGSNLVQLQDYSGAAQAYDNALALYNQLPDDLTVRPYRILWYQTGPYFAYYFTGRYSDVIQLATDNSIAQVKDDEPALEESFYWRAMAEVALGETGNAVEDVQACLKYHQDFSPCTALAQQLGVQP